MATLTFGNVGSRPYGVLTVTETSTNTQNNTSTVSIKLTLKRPYNIVSSVTKTATATVNGTTYTWNGVIGGIGDLVMINQTATIPHNQDGSKTISFSGYILLDIMWNDVYVGEIQGTSTMALTTIPRIKPTIGSVTYKDIDTTCVNITGNNQLIVQNMSLVQFTVTGIGATNATVKSVTAAVNGTTYYLTVSGTTATNAGININSGTDVQAVFTVTDSNGLSTSKTITIKMAAWHVPSAIISAQRQSNYYSATTLTVNADYAQIGSNAVSITYACTDNAQQLATVSGTLQDGVASTVTLDNSTSWTVWAHLTDSFGGKSSYKKVISRGMPIIYFDTNKSSVGVNCFPQGTKTLEVNGVNIFKTVMSATMKNDLKNLSRNTYTKIPLDTFITSGGRLTSSNNGIKIGDGVTQVLVSARMAMQCGSSKGQRYLRIVKNGSVDYTLSWAYHVYASSESGDMIITPLLVNVNAGDVIQLYYYTPNSNDVIGGNSAVATSTCLTVETV